MTHDIIDTIIKTLKLNSGMRVNVRDRQEANTILQLLINRSYFPSEFDYYVSASGQPRVWVGRGITA